MNSTPKLEIDGLSKSFQTITALDEVGLDLVPREVVALIGPNGAGKSTLVDVLSGFVSPDSGSVRWRGRNLDKLSPPQRVAEGIARTFQSLRLAYSLSALDNVLAALHAGRRVRLAPTDRVARDILDRVGLSDASLTPAAALSFGMQKALALACALATDPDVILLDEPFGGLHPQNIELTIDIVRSLRDDGLLVLLVEHDMAAVRAAADRVVVMAKGRIVLDGLVDEILDHPDLADAYLA